MPSNVQDLALVIESRGGEGTPYKGLYGEAPPERGTFSRLQVYERVGISLVVVYESIITLIDCSQSPFFRKMIEIERS